MEEKNQNFDKQLNVRILLGVLGEDVNITAMAPPEVIAYMITLTEEDKNALTYLLLEDIEELINCPGANVRRAHQAKGELLVLLRNTIFN